jgi:CRP/FNR family transcriptional regulator, cyclic AMP receptor protein
VLIVLTPSSWFGEISLFDAQSRTHDAHAAQTTTLLHVPQTLLLAWLQAHPAHWRELALLMADKLRLSFAALEEHSLLPAPQRTARRLVQMAQDYGQGSNDGASRRMIIISQDQLSLMLAISRQTVNQILKDFEANGLLRIRRGVIEILDLKQLLSFSN